MGDVYVSGRAKLVMKVQTAFFEKSGPESGLSRVRGNRRNSDNTEEPDVAVCRTLRRSDLPK